MMGSWSQLYLGQREYSWKYDIPDVLCLIFISNEYKTEKIPLEQSEEEIPYYEHSLITTCDKARTRLLATGINIEYLKRLHFSYFSFDFDLYQEQLEEKITQYMGQKYAGKPCVDDVKKRIEVLKRRLTRAFSPLGEDAEFDRILRLSASSGGKEEFRKKLAKAVRKTQGKKRNPNDNALVYYRESLRDFLLKDPYDALLEPEFLETDDVDLTVLYQVALGVFGSQGTTPIQLDFGEILEGREPMSQDEVQEFLDTMKARLRLRSELLGEAFGRIHVGANIESLLNLIEKSQKITKSKKEKGDVLEHAISRIFSEEAAFSVYPKHRRSDEEIDLVIVNRLSDPFWTSLRSPIILVECRNKNNKVAAKEIRDFELKIANSGGMCRIGIMVSPIGFSRECRVAVARGSREPYRILLVDRNDLKRRLTESASTKSWLEDLILKQL